MIMNGSVLPHMSYVIDTSHFSSLHCALLLKLVELPLLCLLLKTNSEGVLLPVICLTTHGCISCENFLAIFFYPDYPDKDYMSSIATKKHSYDKPYNA